MSDNLHFSSQTDQWATPQAVFDWLDGHLGPYDLDAAADSTNHKCANYIGSDVDALTVPWSGSRVWLNPPYGRGLGRWATKAIEEIDAGNCDSITIHCLPYLSMGINPSEQCGVIFKPTTSRESIIVSAFNRIYKKLHR